MLKNVSGSGAFIRGIDLLTEGEPLKRIGQTKERTDKAILKKVEPMAYCVLQ